MKRITIAIDGYSSCGKSTMAKALAKALGYIYVDTGAMYRTVTLYAMRNGLFDEKNHLDTDALKTDIDKIDVRFVYNKETSRADTYLGSENVEGEIRGMAVSDRVSIVAAIGFVREAMVERQRAMGQNKGVVMDGRDIGTTVFPDAELKLFVTATAEVRAQRRFDELRGKGIQVDYDDVLSNVKERDYIDSHREVSPLRMAQDAILLDNSDMTITEQDEWALKLAKEKIGETI